MWFLQSLFLSFLLVLFFPFAGLAPVYAPLNSFESNKLTRKESLPAKCRCNSEIEKNQFYEPRRIRIEKIGLDSPIFPVGADFDGYLAMPKDSKSVGWFFEGVRVGELGNLVLVGHFNLPGGKPGVFSRLGELTVGDTITIESTVAYKYLVASVDWVYENDPQRLRKVFRQSVIPIVTLVTCGGQWQADRGTYDRRLLIRGIARN